MVPKLCLLLAVFTALVAVASADIFGDLLGWDVVGAFTGAEKKEEKSGSGQKREEEVRGCQCEGMRCNCCVDFNLTSLIDLGGPGCVRMLYLSKDKGVALNVSYGDSLLHSQTVTQKDKKGSCMDLLSELAQICARFSDLKTTDDGLQGCLNFEPHVLGEVTSKYPVGCFSMGPEGMFIDTSLQDQQEESEDGKPEESAQEEESSSILDVVNQSAEQGIAFISDLFGFKVSGTKKGTTPADVKGTTETSLAEEEADDEDEEGDSVSDSNSQDESSRKLSSVRTRAGRIYGANDV